MRSKGRLIFLGLCVLSVLGLGVIYWLRSTAQVATETAVISVPQRSTDSSVETPKTSADKGEAVSANIADSKTEARALPTEVKGAASPVTQEQLARRRIFFRWTEPDAHYGQLAYRQYPPLGKPQFVSSLSCESVHFSNGKGSCLRAQRGVFTKYSEEIFDADFQVLHRVPLAGIPSRTRVSRDGGFAAVTVFITGHGYDSVDFSTQTTIVDTHTGKVIADLETFTVTREGEPFQAADFNYWGVTFAADNDTFYATLSSARKHYLIQGSIRSRSAHVIHDNVECPSLSPDGKRVAYKKRLPGDRVQWQIQVLELATQKEIALAERRSVDDQLEWLDDSHVLYSLPRGTGPSPTTDVWIAAVDSTDKPRVFLESAYSPAVVHGALGEK